MAGVLQGHGECDVDVDAGLDAGTFEFQCRGAGIPETVKVAGFSLHAGVAARANQRQKLERLCRYISRPAIADQRLSLTPNGNVRAQVRRLDSARLRQILAQ